MAENERTDQKTNSHGDCCGGHCESEKSEKVDVKSSDEFSEGSCCDHDHAEHDHSHDETEEKTQTTTLSSDPDWKLQATYLAAEIENMQKRFMREASDIRKYANEDILKRVVPVLDTLSLALDAAAKAKTLPENEGLFANKLFQGFLQGVEMTAKQFEQVLQASGVEFVETEGKDFDPNLHEALGQTKKDGLPNNKVTEVFQRGFKLGGRVVRPAKVMVNKV